MTTSTTPLHHAPPGTVAPVTGWSGVVKDWSSDREAFAVPWSKAMMWIFLVSDTFVFSCFLIGYMTVRTATVVPWPNASVVFGLNVGGVEVPLLLIALMTFVLISSSGTMAMAVHFANRGDRINAATLMCVTAVMGEIFVGMQGYEWSKLILHEGIRPWGNPIGAPQFGSSFFMITGFHGLHVTAGVITLLTVAIRMLRGRYEGSGYRIVEVVGLYWHFVDLVWVFIFALFYLW